MSKNLHNVKFDFIRYANCWEDADILLEGLRPKPGSRLISICSAGDNSFSLLVTNPAEVIAVDVNPVQLWLTELKMTAIKNLNRHEYLAFAGFTTSNKRLEVYKGIKSQLSPEALAYWDENLAVIEKGIIYGGKFERYVGFFSHRLMPLIHGRKRRNALFLPKSEKEQGEFYISKWNNLRWKWFFRIFFSKRVMGKYGRDPKFLEQVKMNVSQYIYSKSAVHLSSAAAQQNYMLRFIIMGSFSNELPHYVRVENYDVIKSRLDRIHLKKGFIQDIAAENGKFDGFNLSNIFEYLDRETFTQAAQKLIQSASQQARMAYWNLMVPRNMAEAGGVERKRQTSAELTQRDKGFFYNCFCIDAIH